MPRVELSEIEALRQVKQINYYDAIVLDRSYAGAFHPQNRSVQLFGNRNVGMHQFTNMQVAGMLPTYDGVAIIKRWYARTNIGNASAHSALMAWAHSAVVTLVLGSRLTWTLSIAELLDRRPRENADSRMSCVPWPLTVPPRMDLHVRIDQHDNMAMDRLEGELVPERAPPGCMLWVHLEGVSAPSSSLVLANLQVADQEYRTAEERIAHWITGQARSMRDNDPATADAVSVLVDGILEGRARS